MPLAEEQKKALDAKRRMTAALKEESRAPRRGEATGVAGEGDVPDSRAGRGWRAMSGCGLPIIDSLGNWPGTMYLTAEQRVEYNADQERYKEMHPDCDAHRWSMSGSRATHCGYCCPSIPMSRAQFDHIHRIFTSSPRREEELDIWERTLACGHVVEQSVHHANPHPSFSTALCPECQMTRGVVTSTKTVEASARKAEAERNHDDRVARAERELKMAEKAAVEARKKLNELRVNR